MIEVTLLVNPQGDYFLHLLNYTGEMERPIKRIVSFEDVVVRLRTAADPAQVDALRTGERLGFERDGAYLVMRLNQLTHHEVLRIQWRQP